MGEFTNIIAALFDPICQILHLTRHQTSFHASVRENAIEHHTQILNAIRRSTPAKAGWAMRAHLEQTERDLDTYVTTSGEELRGLSAADFRVADAERPPNGTTRPTRPATPKSRARTVSRTSPPPKDSS